MKIAGVIVCVVFTGVIGFEWGVAMATPRRNLAVEFCSAITKPVDAEATCAAWGSGKNGDAALGRANGYLWYCTGGPDAKPTCEAVGDVRPLAQRGPAAAPTH